MTGSAGPWTAGERSLLALLDARLREPRAASTVAGIVRDVAVRASESAAPPMLWQPVPLDAYEDLPPEIRSSWVFWLRAGLISGAERHPNSRQRMVSYNGAGTMQLRDGDGPWRNIRLESDPGQPLERRWVSIPVNGWHQVVVSSAAWIVVSFHTVPAGELIEERPAASGEITQRRYVDSH